MHRFSSSKCTHSPWELDASRPPPRLSWSAVREHRSCRPYDPIRCETDRWSSAMNHAHALHAAKSPVHPAFRPRLLSRLDDKVAAALLEGARVLPECEYPIVCLVAGRELRINVEDCVPVDEHYAARSGPSVMSEPQVEWQLGERERGGERDRAKEKERERERETASVGGGDTSHQLRWALTLRHRVDDAERPPQSTDTLE